MQKNGRFAQFLAGLCCTGVLSAAIAADTYPDKPIRMLVGYPPGSATDLYGRAIAQKVGQDLGQALVVENRPGAAGNIAVDALVRSPGDGYTVLNSASQIVINPFVQKLSYDPLDDLIPVTQTIAVSYVLVTRSDFPADDLPSFLKKVSVNSSSFNYGSYGPGSGPHLTMVMLQRLAKLSPVHIPYKGSPQMLTALMAGEIDMTFDTTTSIAPLLASGRIKAIAVAGPEPVDMLPGVRPIAETFPGFDTDGWQGIFVPKETPQKVVDTLAKAVQDAMAAADIQTMSKERGVRIVASPPSVFKSYFAEELEKYRQVVQENNIKLE